MSQPVQKHRPSPSGGANYKSELDEAASRAKSPPQEKPEEQQGSSIVDKVSKYVPASVGKMLGAQSSQDKQPERAPSPASRNPPGPPDRPVHDTQIEEFIKDQHHSKQVVGIDEPTQA